MLSPLRRQRRPPAEDVNPATDNEGETYEGDPELPEEADEQADAEPVAEKENDEPAETTEEATEPAEEEKPAEPEVRRNEYARMFGACFTGQSL